MDNQTRTLGSNINLKNQQTQGQENAMTSFNTYLTLFSINLAYRFPDVTDLNTIDVNTVQRIAEFSAACSTVALEVWEQQTTNYSERRNLVRQTRAS